MMGLTQSQRELLEFIRAEVKEKGIAPTFDKIRVALNYSNKGCIYRLVGVLIDKGYIIRARRYAPIKLAEPQYDHGPDCMCLRCPARTVQYQQFVQALENPAPILAGNNFKALGLFDRTCWRIGFPKLAHPETRKPQANMQPAQVMK